MNRSLDAAAEHQMRLAEACLEAGQAALKRGGVPLSVQYAMASKRHRAIARGLWDKSVALTAKRWER